MVTYYTLQVVRIHMYECNAWLQNIAELYRLMLSFHFVAKQNWIRRKRKYMKRKAVDGTVLDTPLPKKRQPLIK